MFYIDFTAPDGKTYRIDMSTHPVTYECPVCGELTIYTFNPNDENCCIACVERQEQELEKVQLEKGRYTLLSMMLNHEFGMKITPDEIRNLGEDPATGEFSKDMLIEGIKNRFAQLNRVEQLNRIKQSKAVWSSSNRKKVTMIPPIKSS